MPNDGVKVVINRKIWQDILRDAGREPMILLNAHGFTGNIAHLARVMLAAQDHLGRYDAQLLAANVKVAAGGGDRCSFVFTGLELL